MYRRQFIKAFAAAFAGFTTSSIAQGQQITLQREPTNTFDVRAVAVYWEQQKLGFIPRLDNAAISQLLNRGEILIASIYSLAESDNPWERVEVEVRWTI